MDDPTSPTAAHLFTLRVWRAETIAGQAEWRGRLQHVLSGESRYFRDWPALVSCLGTLLEAPEHSQPVVDAAERDKDE
jgi:hypothetical protein